MPNFVNLPAIYPIGFPLKILNRAMGWTPGNLFQASEQGAWYDPSDLSTLFQDDAGTTPVTADGNPVGLMLDKSQGLVLGDSAFQSPVWNGNWVDDGGGAYTHTAGATSDLYADSDFFEPGDLVRVTVTASVSAGSFLVYARGGTTSANITTSGTHVLHVVSGSIGANDAIVRANAGFSGTVSGISFEKVPGNHASQATTSKRPTYKTDGTLHWLDDDGVDDDMSATLPSIASATVAIARSTGADITYPVDLSSGSYTVDGDGYGWVIVDRALTAGETSDLTAYLDNKAGV